MNRFSLRWLMVMLTLAAVFCATVAGTARTLAWDMPVFEYAVAFLAGVGVVLLLLYAAAALDPLLPPPRRLVEVEQAEGPISTGIPAMVLPVFLAPIPTLAAGLLGYLVVSNWDGQFNDSFAEMGLDVLAIPYFMLTAALMFTALALLAALHAGSPLGRWAVYPFGAALGALTAGFFAPISMINYTVYAIIGFLLLVLGILAARFWDRGALRGFARRARCWSARGGLLLGGIGAAVPWLLTLGQFMGGFDLDTLIPFAGAVGLTLGSLIGVLLGSARKSVGLEPVTPQ